MRKISVLVSGVMLVLSAQASASKTISYKGVCSITTGTVSGKKYATLKCHKVDEPGHYSIRATKWERKDKEEYRNLARHAGRKFTCTFTQNGFVYLPQKHKNVDMSDCR